MDGRVPLNLTTLSPTAGDDLAVLDNPGHPTQQLIVQRIVGFTLAGIAGFGNLLLLLCALCRLCGSRCDLVHGLGLHAALLGLLHAGYVVVLHTLVASFPQLLNYSRLWRFNCVLFGFLRQLLPSAYLCLMLVVLVSFGTSRLRNNSRRRALWRCLGVVAHAFPWLFGLSALLPLFVMREADALFGTSQLCVEPIGDDWTLLTLMAARGAPLAFHCFLTIGVTLRRTRAADSPRRLPVVVVLYLLMALLTEGVFLVSKTIDILIVRSHGKPKFTSVERQGLAWTQFCHFCLAPPLLIFLVVHVQNGCRRMGLSSNRKCANNGSREEVLYTNCMLTSV